MSEDLKVLKIFSIEDIKNNYSTHKLTDNSQAHFNSPHVRVIVLFLPESGELVHLK